jgi:hypothetical protein
MTKLVDEFWNVRWPGYQAEIGIEPYDCPQAWDCHCLAEERRGGKRTRCGSPLAEVRAEVASHYRDRASYLESLSDDEFLVEMGYHESKDYAA